MHLIVYKKMENKERKVNELIYEVISIFEVVLGDL